MDTTTHVAKQTVRKFLRMIARSWNSNVPLLGQILKEFRWPFALALAWTAYNVLSFPTESVSTFVGRFAASFFFGSWAMGQIVRIKRHKGMENSFDRVFKYLAELTSDVGHLSAASRELQQTARNNPELRLVAEDISDLAFSANTSVAAANMAFSQAMMQEPASRRREDALFGAENPQRWEVWRALLQRGDDRHVLVQLGRGGSGAGKTSPIGHCFGKHLLIMILTSRS